MAQARAAVSSGAVRSSIETVRMMMSLDGDGPTRLQWMGQEWLSAMSVASPQALGSRSSAALSSDSRGTSTFASSPDAEALESLAGELRSSVDEPWFSVDTTLAAPSAPLREDPASQAWCFDEDGPGCHAVPPEPSPAKAFSVASALAQAMKSPSYPDGASARARQTWARPSVRDDARPGFASGIERPPRA